jgi:hypothetical protein
MPVYTPSLQASVLESSPVTTGFYIEDPAKPGQTPPAMKRNPDLPVFYHGQFLEDKDLNIIFCSQGTLGLEPLQLSYAVGFFYEGTDRFSPIGNPNREPLFLRVGRYRPSFIVGDKWYTGRYAIRWTYTLLHEDTPRETWSLFWLDTEGVLDKKASMPLFDLPATVVVIP